MRGSPEATGPDWRDEVQRQFTPGAVRLAVVDDPDGLLVRD